MWFIIRLFVENINIFVLIFNKLFIHKYFKEDVVDVVEICLTEAEKEMDENSSTAEKASR